MLKKLRPLFILLSFIGLGLTVIPSILVSAGIIAMDINKDLMFAGTVLWFGTVVFWMNREKKNKDTNTG